MILRMRLLSICLCLALSITELNSYCKRGYVRNYKVGMSNCNLSKVPTNIPNPGTVHHYFLTQNCFKSFEERAFQKYFHLQEVALGTNQICSIHPTAFSGTIINRLELYENNLHCVPDLTSINNTLTYLDLSQYQLGMCESPNTKCLSNFYRLESLCLSSNYLTYLPHIIYCTKRLKDLVLSFNQFTSIPDLSKILKRPYTSRHLQLYGNPITCDCEATWLRKYEEKYEVRAVPWDYKCTTGKHTGLCWSDLKSEDTGTLCPPTTAAEGLELFN